MILAAALLTTAAIAVLIVLIARDDRTRRAAARRRVIDQATWPNPMFTQGLRPCGGLPPQFNTPEEEPCQAARQNTMSNVR